MNFSVQWWALILLALFVGGIGPEIVEFVYGVNWNTVITR